MLNLKKYFEIFLISTSEQFCQIGVAKLLLFFWFGDTGWPSEIEPVFPWEKCTCPWTRGCHLGGPVSGGFASPIAAPWANPSRTSQRWGMLAMCYTGLLLRKIQTPTAGVIFSAYLQALFEISYYSLFESLRASLRCACGNCGRGRYSRRPTVQNLSTLTSLHHLQPLLPLGFIPRQPNT